MDLKSTGNFIMIRPYEGMKNDISPIAIFNIVGINGDGTTEYYPIMSNFYDTALWFDGDDTLMDINDNNPVPPQVLQNHMVNKIEYNGTIYWLSMINGDSQKYRAIENSADYITISSTDNWNTYTVMSGGGVQ